MSRTSAVTVALLSATALAGGCEGVGSPYARFQHRAEELQRIDALVAAIPRYPGAWLSQRQDSSTDYRVGFDDYVRAKPYESVFYYSAPGSGAEVQRWFRQVMTTRRFTCQFNERRSGVPYGFRCRGGHQVVNAYIADHDHYELDVWADDRRAPIPTIPDD